MTNLASKLADSRRRVMNGWMWFVLVLGTFEAIALVSMAFDYWYFTVRKSQQRWRKVIWFPRDVTAADLDGVAAQAGRGGGR
jgi:hypothetical protein